ncbi:demethylmenaquinone methyltransferase [Cellulomonas taurus]|uniref:demethylmenaquinone methyltransferase n=1 Tax=Cellulomonas taurus TaxID=2729175 RepID=UPI00145FAFBA|nr:demethylmenaquinone methyltransferase [Cellulomonas taurus]
MSRASLDKDPHDVAAMFDGVARRYDLTNDVLSLGQDRAWRRATLTALQAVPGEKVLDLAAGTGTSSEPLADAGVRVVPCDISTGMLAVGKQRRPDLPFTAGDATALPFADDSFDAVTISFGLRNVVDTVAALEEMRRVVRPGGRLVICEFSTPSWKPFRAVYDGYLTKALPAVARVVAKQSAAYTYLAESIQDWPDQLGLASLMKQAGWGAVAYRNLTGGIVALHRATNPEH